MSAFGVQPFGGATPWGGPGQIAIIRAMAIGENSIAVRFTGAPRWQDPLGYRDARKARLWEVVPVDPVAVIDGVEIVEDGKRRPQFQPWVGEVLRDADDPTRLILRTVPSLEPGVEYDVGLVGPIVGQSCEALAGITTSRIRALNAEPGKPSREAALDQLRDYGAPIYGDGFWSYSEGGDVQLADGPASLRQRVIRRVQTTRGGFAFFSGYGVRPLKGSQARPSDVQAMATELREEILREPDVANCGVTGRIENTATGGSVVIFDVIVHGRSVGAVSFRVQVPSVD